MLAQTRALLENLQRLTQHIPDEVGEAILSLSTIRREVYEHLNQLQHEHLILKARHYLQALPGMPADATWEWNPRQTGDYREPDLRATHQGVVLVSAEVTTSEKPVGVIGSRMGTTLIKLNQMKGELYYFVRTEAMKRRADFKVKRDGLNIQVAYLPDWARGKAVA